MNREPAFRSRNNVASTLRAPPGPLSATPHLPGRACACVCTHIYTKIMTISNKPVSEVRLAFQVFLKMKHPVHILSCLASLTRRICKTNPCCSCSQTAHPRCRRALHARLYHRLVSILPLTDACVAPAEGRDEQCCCKHSHA